ncbi:MAG TPA: cupredoxin domain-containing protein [Oligoflexus sp.]|uniref:cupredoxin domain-containing protein n=1 Tax=Oligoflexus sp. TaxID=1971216 RepID=UPI002D2393DD|nr:cupredoxin domain-containing protein [Oligoflexus sp.]HYX31979.1 cupredoxin domain-containing protein [Oligoflexus sp.]
MMKVWLMGLGLTAISGSAPSASSQTENVLITLRTDGNEIAFDRTSIQVPAGRRIQLRFVNGARPGSEILHNVAILKSGTLDEVLRALQKNSYNLDAMSQHPAVLAMTRSLAPAEEQTLEFNPLKPGVYPFICFMAGHGDMLGMKGQLIVSP